MGESQPYYYLTGNQNNAYHADAKSQPQPQDHAPILHAVAVGVKGRLQLNAHHLEANSGGAVPLHRLCDTF